LLEETTPGVTTFELESIEPGRLSWPTLVFVNGRFSSLLSRTDDLPDGVQAVSLAAVLADESHTARTVLARIAEFENHSFAALNTAHFSDGACITIRAGTQSAVPLRLMYVADGGSAGGVIHPRNLIVAGANSRLSVIESYVGTADVEYMTNAVTEISVGRGATVSHYRLQSEGLKAFHVGTVQAVQARDSQYQSFSFAVGARLSRANIYTALDGEGCGATLNGLYMVDGTQHVDHQTRVVHSQPNCYSRELYKGILDGSSHAVFNGKVYVHPTAQKTDGKQSNNNLLLSESARVDTKPQLEIFADDVKCTHGATVGRIDEVALFYMKSRGIDARSARHLLTYAFAAEVLEEIELEELRRELESLSMKRYAVGVTRGEA
jgi:Fe-S cluster assembly protein SufD